MSQRPGTKSSRANSKRQAQDQKAESEEEGHHSHDELIDVYANELDPKNQQMVNDLVHGLGSVGVGKSMERAQEIIKRQMLNEENNVTLEALDLQDLSFMRQEYWDSLEEIYVNRNMLTNIDVLQIFQKLKIVNACNNYIEQVNLYLPQLQSLNLQNNFLKKFPHLENMRKLTYLNLSSNQIVDFKDFQPENIPNLKTLEVEDNQIDFQEKEKWVPKENDEIPQQFQITRDDFGDFIKKMSVLEKLRSLNMAGNPVMSGNCTRYKRKIFNKLQNLELFNGDSQQQIQQQLEIEDNPDLLSECAHSHDDDQPVDNKTVAKKLETLKERKDKEEKRKIRPPPSLENLLANLDAANSHPQFAADHIKVLWANSNELIEKLDMIDEYFVPEERKKMKEEDKGEDPEVISKMLREEQELRDELLQDNIESFMQMIGTLIDNHLELQTILLQILAKLSIIKFKDFGFRCFSTLKDLMKSGRDMRHLIENVIRIEVINKMKQFDPTVIPVSLLVGLHEMIEETEASSMLTGMYDLCFPIWLRLYCEKLDFFKQTNEEMGNHDHYDAIIKLMAISVKDNPENVDLLIQKNLTVYICKIIKQTSWDHDRYIPCLKLVERVSKGKREAADLFIETHFHTLLLEKKIGKQLLQYKKGKTLYDDKVKGKESLERQMMKFETLASEIFCLGGLLNCSPDKTFPLTGESYRESIWSHPHAETIVQMTSFPKFDPIMLTAVCSFTLDVFKCEEIRDRREKMRPFADRLDNLKKLIPLLGMEKFQELLTISRKYYSVVQGKSQKRGQNDESDIMRSGNKGDIQKTLSRLNDPIINGLFIQIIKLITFCCEQAEINGANDLFDQISHELNELNRETALFNALHIEDDDVKLAVVRCLYVVPLDEFEEDEISQITKIMGSQNNLGAGQTELVLSTLYWMCCRFVMAEKKSNDPNTIKICRSFQEKFGQKIVTLATQTLSKNLKRSIDLDDEDEEKYCLSLSILNFLKCSSLCEPMQPHLQGPERKAEFKAILKNEETYSTLRVKRIPIDIENTYIGRQMNCLLNCIDGTDSLLPYTDVSLRVIMRMADVLMARHKFKVFEHDMQEDMCGDLITHHEKLYTKKKKKEKDYWIDMPDRYIQDLDEQTKKEHQNQHYVFTKSNGVALIKMFLTTKVPQNEQDINSLTDPCFNESQFNPGERNQQQKYDLKDGLKQEKERLETKFKAKYQQQAYKSDPKGDYQDPDMKIESTKRSNGGEFCIREAMLAKERKAQQQLHEITLRQQSSTAKKSGSVDVHTSKTSKDGKFMQAQRFESLGEDYKDKLGQAQTFEQREQILNKRNAQKMIDLINDPNAGKISNHILRKDGFGNKELRILTIAAYLRCLLATIEYAPTNELKNDAIKNIKDEQQFRTITKLCDSTNWDVEANIAPKYLRIMRFIIQLPVRNQNEDSEKIMHYQLVAKVIEKSMTKIVYKMNNLIELTDGDKIAIYEISTSLFTIIQQSTNFKHTDLSLMDNHFKYEDIIKQERLRDSTLTEEQLLKQDKLEKFHKLQWRLKCQKCAVDAQQGEIDSADYDKWIMEVSKQNYQVDLTMLESKRSIQSKLVEFMIDRILSKECIFLLVDILFKDMKEDYKLIEGETESEESDKGAPDEGAGSGDDDDSGDDMDGDSLQEYIDLKGVLTIEKVKDIVGEIICSCPKTVKFEIMQKIVRNMVFRGEKMRQSFMQEILNAADAAAFKQALQNQINRYDEKKIIKNYYKHYHNVITRGTDQDRVIEFSGVDMNLIIHEQVHDDEKIPRVNPNFVQRLFVLTNNGIQIMKTIPKTLQCSNCPVYKFCPTGPIQDFCIRFANIETIINFPQMPQKLVIRFKELRPDIFDPNKDGYKGGYKYQMTINIPTYTKAAKIYKNLLEIMQKQLLIAKKSDTVVLKKEQWEEYKKTNPIRVQIEEIKEQIEELAKKRGKDHHEKEKEKEKLRKEQNRLKAKNDIFKRQFKIGYLDKMVQFELKMIFSQISNKIHKKEICKMQIIMASLLSIDNIPEDYFNKVVDDTVQELQGFPPMKKIDEISSEAMYEFMLTYKFNNGGLKYKQQRQIPKCVDVCVVQGYVVLLREKWDNWAFFEEAASITNFKKKQMKSGFYTARNMQQDDTSQRGNSLKQMCQNIKSNLFDVVCCLKISEISNVLIHDGKDPSVEVKSFQGDMERQRFVEAINSMMKEKQLEESDDEDKQMDKQQKAAKGSDEEESDEDDEEHSEEEVVEAIIYD